VDSSESTYKVGLECLSVRPSTKSFLDFNEIWPVEVDEWCMAVCSMTQSKVKVTSLWKLEIRPFQRLSLPPFIIGAGKWPQILKLGHNTYSLSWPDFWFLSQFLCHVTLKSAVSRSRPSVPYGANLYSYSQMYFCWSLPSLLWHCWLWKGHLTYISLVIPTTLFCNKCRKKNEAIPLTRKNVN